MTDQWWNDEEQLLQELGDAIRSGMEVPQRFLMVGKGAFAWRNIDAELAELVYDSSSAGDAEKLARARTGPVSIRSMTFATGQLTIEVEAAADGLRGQLVPAVPGEVEVHCVDEPTVTVVVDEVGWFVISPIPRGSFQLRVRTESGVTARTGWITL